MSSPKAARTTEEKNHDSVPFNRRSQKKNGWPVPTAREFALFRHRVTAVDPRHRRRGSLRSIHGVTGCKGRPNLQRNDDQSPAATVKQFSERESIGKCTTICTRHHPPLGIAKWPVEDRTTIGSASLQTYGAPADITGRMQSRWQTNSGSLVFDVRWFAL